MVKSQDGKLHLQPLANSCLTSQGDVSRCRGMNIGPKRPFMTFSLLEGCRGIRQNDVTKHSYLSLASVCLLPFHVFFIPERLPRDFMPHPSKKQTARYNNLTGDVLISSGIIAYLGCFLAKYRNESVESWISLMQAVMRLALWLGVAL